MCDYVYSKMNRILYNACHKKLGQGLDCTPDTCQWQSEITILLHVLNCGY